MLLRGGVRAIDNMPENAPCCVARRLRRPGGAVPPNRLPALPTLGSAINHDVRNGLAFLAARMETAHCHIPYDFARFEGSNFIEANPLSLHRHCRSPDRGCFLANT